MNEKEMDKKLPLVRHAAYLHTMDNLCNLMHDLTEKHRMLMHLTPEQCNDILGLIRSLQDEVDMVNASE